MEVALNYSADEDGVIRLEKTLNHLLTHLDHENVRQLYTEYCNIQSAAGETVINGPLLTMYDVTPTLRLLAGYDSSTGDFVFKLFNAIGEETISLDAGGDAIFQGDVQTPKDAYVGEHLFIGADSTDIPYTGITTNTRGIFIPVPGTTNILGHIYSTNPGGASTDWDFEIESSQALNITAKRNMQIFHYAGYDGVSTVSIDSTGFMHIQSFNNRMFINIDHAISPSATDKGLFLGSDAKEVYMGASRTPMKQVAAIGDCEYDIKYNLEYFYSRNQKLVAVPTSDWTEGSSNNVHHNGTSESITSTRSVWWRVATTSSAYAEMLDTFASVDMTKFEDGSAATTDDYIVFICHTNDTGGMMPTHGFHFQIGDGSTNYFRYYNMASNGQPFSTGWNVIKRKIGSYQSVSGSPNLNNITGIRCGYRAYANSTGTIITVDSISIHRADPDGAEDFNDFQVEANSTWVSWFANTSDEGKWLMHSNAGSPCLCSAAIDYGGFGDLYIKDSHYFISEMKVHTLNSNELPMITWFYDVDNFFNASISSGVMRISLTANGTTGANYTNCEAFTAYSDVTFRAIKAPGGRYMAMFGVDGEPGTLRTVEFYSTYDSNLEGSVYIGTQNDSAWRVKTFTVKPYVD